MQQDCPPPLPTSKRLAMLMPTLVGERQACGHCGGLIETAECRPTRLDVSDDWLERPGDGSCDRVRRSWFMPTTPMRSWRQGASSAKVDSPGLSRVTGLR